MSYGTVLSARYNSLYWHTLLELLSFCSDYSKVRSSFQFDEKLCTEWSQVPIHTSKTSLAKSELEDMNFFIPPVSVQLSPPPHETPIVAIFLGWLC